VQPYRLGLTG